MREACAATGQVPPDLVQFRWPSGSRAFRSITFFGAAGYDRSPCGTATSALAAFCAETGLLGPGDSLTNTTLFGTSFRAGVHRAPDGLCPEIAARAFRTGEGRLCLSKGDPLTSGLTAPDIL
ncbi:proline racemase family protein [Tabrizicola soli]